jgi:phytoene dehydrogenase-like protein
VSRFDAIIVGAGVNGLTTAAFLARRGKTVLVLERRETIGGTAATEEFHPGYRVNVCGDDPGWMPRQLARDLRLARHGLRVTDAPVGLVAVRAAAPPIAVTERAARAVSVAGLSQRDAERWRGFCDLVGSASRLLELLYSRSAPIVQSQSTAELLSILRVGRRLRALGRRRMMDVTRAIPMPVADLVGEWVDEPSLAGALATLGIHGVQHGPLSSGTGFVFLHRHVGWRTGQIGMRHVVAGGRGALADAIAASAQAAGTRIRTNADVAQITIRDGRVSGVALHSGEELSSPLVVSGVDPRRTFGLVDAMWLDADLLRAVDNVRMRGATARVHFALDGLPAFSTDGKPWDDGIARGTIVVSPGVMGLERAYDDAKFGQMPAEPALTVTVPSLLDAALAPPARHVLSVDVHHVPYRRHGGWGDRERAALGDLVEARLAQVAWDFRDRILARWILTPADLEERFGVAEGSLTHGELALDQALFMRPVPQCARHATPLPGLWLCGTGTHPASHAGACGLLAAHEIVASERRGVSGVT